MEAPVGFNKGRGTSQSAGTGESLTRGMMLELEKETKGPNNGRVGLCRRKCQDVPRYWGTEWRPGEPCGGL